jgi:hypothetical protein
VSTELAPTLAHRAPCIAIPDYIAGVKVSKALFSGPTGPEDLAFIDRKLARLEQVTAGKLFGEYQRRRQQYQAKSANLWLRMAADTAQAQQDRFPVPIRRINEEARREAVAREWATQVNAIVSHLTQGFTVPQPAAELLAAAMAPARQWGFSPVLPDLSGEVTDKHLDHAASALARLQDEDWWLRQIRRAYQRHRELVAIMAGDVRRGVSPYVSHRAFVDYRSNKVAQARWLADMLVVNEDQGLELSLAEAHAASVSNPEIRRVELMVRMRGFEDLAWEQGHAAEFYTWTTPSRFHAWNTVKEDRGRSVRNKRYRGTSPRDAQAYLCRQWAKARAAMARAGITVYGFRVVEPHHDGTPHWHMLFFVEPAQRDQLREILGRYACEHDQDEIKNHRSARFDVLAIDPAYGSATGYIAKYIAKNIDGHRVGDDYEAEAQANETATNVAAWASLWGIRQFQQIGGPSVTVWRELRRLREAVEDPLIEPARVAADAGNWAEFIGAMGGVSLPRQDRPIKLAHLVTPCASKYGEDLRRLVGVTSAGGCSMRTRLDGWAVVKKSPARGCGERSELPLSGGSRAPWSSDNNCTGQMKPPSLAVELAAAGLDAVDRGRMEAGAVVVMRGLYHWIRDGRLYKSRHRPQFDRSPAPAGRSTWVEDRDREQLQQRRLNRQALAVLAGDLPLDEYIEAAPDTFRAVHTLETLLDKERCEAPASFHQSEHLARISGFVSSCQSQGGAL